MNPEELIKRARLRVAERITDLIGDTPIVRLRTFERDTPGVELWAKCEFFNPGGSVKDRAAYQMIRDAMRTGLLRDGQTIIDSTSGNTGVAYSLIGGALGFPVTLVMPGNVSWARQKITKAFGTELIFSDPMEGSDGAIRLCRQIVADNPGKYFYPDQYSNLSNPLGHYNTTGREIWEQTEGRVTHFVTGIGTTGTVMGTGRRLKEYRRDIQVFAVEPADALHGLEGLKHMASSIVPGIYHPDELDGVLPMDTDEAWDVADRLAKEEGLLVGHSSGASLAGGIRIAKKLAADKKPGVIVTLFPDRAERYFEAPIIPKAPPEAGAARLSDIPAPHPTVSTEALAVMYAHARRDYPNECCGIVFGPKDGALADRAVPCANIQNQLHEEDPVTHTRDARTAYNLAAGDIFKLQKSLRGDSPAKIVYHSHVEVGAYFSETDQTAAQMEGEPSYPVEYVVIDVRADAIGGAAQFAWDPASHRYVEIGRYPGA